VTRAQRKSQPDGWRSCPPRCVRPSAFEALVKPPHPDGNTWSSSAHRQPPCLGRVAERWHAALFDLITILGDSDAAYGSISHIDDEQLDAMRRNWRGTADKEELCRRIIDLRLIYDWPALKSVVSLCPGSATDNFRLNPGWVWSPRTSPLRDFWLGGPGRRAILRCPKTHRCEERASDYSASALG
jgi:hypothetical protein